MQRAKWLPLPEDLYKLLFCLWVVCYCLPYCLRKCISIKGVTTQIKTHYLECNYAIAQSRHRHYSERKLAQKKKKKRQFCSMTIDIHSEKSAKRQQNCSPVIFSNTLDILLHTKMLETNSSLFFLAVHFAHNSKSGPNFYVQCFCSFSYWKGGVWAIQSIHISVDEKRAQLYWVDWYYTTEWSPFIGESWFFHMPCQITLCGRSPLTRKD